MHRIFRFSLAALLLLTSACSSKAPVEPKSVEIPPAKEGSKIADTPERELFEQAQRYYEEGLFSVAKDNFDSLRTSYPLSPYAEYAALKMNDCDFQERDFAGAAAGYESFLKDHPLSDGAPYAMLMAGRSYQLGSKGPGRDVAPLKKAADNFDKVASQYPTSPYAEPAVKYGLQVKADIAEHEKLILNFYKHQNNSKAVEARSKIFEEKYKPAIDAKPAQVAEATIAEAAATTPATVQAFAKQPLSSKAEVIATKAKGSIGEAQAATNKNAKEQASTGQRLPFAVQRVDCEDKNQVILYLDESVDRSFAQNALTLEPKKGVLSVQLPTHKTRSLSEDCFATKDLSVSESGEVSLQSDRHGQLVSLDNPPRLLMMLE